MRAWEVALLSVVAVAVVVVLVAQTLVLTGTWPW